MLKEWNISINFDEQLYKIVNRQKRVIISIVF